MKKVLTIMAMFLCVATLSVFTSCKDDEKKPNSELIIGSWHLDKVFFNGAEMEQSSQIETVWDFREGGTATITVVANGFPLSLDYTYTIDDEHLVTYTSNGNVNMDAKILKLNEGALEYEFTEDNDVRRHVLSKITDK